MTTYDQHFVGYSDFSAFALLTLTSDLETCSHNMFPIVNVAEHLKKNLYNH